MRVLLQRVSGASVTVDGVVRGEVGAGLLALVGIGHGDDDAMVRKLAGKTARLRMFSDEEGRTNRSVLDIGGAVLVVSQFTLYANARRGNRPSFTEAAEPELARRLVEVFRSELESLGVPTASGVFGASMRVALTNEGPFTVWLDSADWTR